MPITPRGPETWATEPGTRALRIEPAPGHLYLLPYDQFVFAELEREADDQRLRVIFATHELVVSGRFLKRIVDALQRGELGHLTLLPENVRATIPTGQPVIQNLEVRTVEISSNGQGVDALAP